MSSTYVKLTHKEHVLVRPDSYIGTIVQCVDRQWLRVAAGFSPSEVSYSPGLFKIFDEIIVNAIDHHKSVIKINTTSDSISVENLGASIPIEKHDKEGIWVPELIFGHLLTSSNYDDTEERTTGGRNGYGAKLTNIFSKKFIIEICDGKLKYEQTWDNNMGIVGSPVITKLKVGKSVKVTFTPDWSIFSGSRDGFWRLVEKRAWDASLYCAVELNGVSLPALSFVDFAKLHFGEAEVVRASFPGLEVVIGKSTTHAFEQVSFVNGISTTKGGSHVDRVVSALIAGILKDKKLAAAEIKPAQVKSSLFVFVKATVVNPTFSSQTKAECTSKLPVITEMKPKFVKDVAALIATELQSLSLKKLSKTDGVKRSRLTGIPKLDDANWAGTTKSHECTLIITEGDSAKALAISGLTVVGRDAYGVFPLRGKPRNVRDATVKQVTENEEISNLKKILGLAHGKVYTNLRELRYGRLMIMTDADLDGSHIKGLVLNLIHVYWPELIRLGFVVSMVTPVIKAGSTWFFTEEAFREAKPTGAVKYYKGLGTSTAAEAKEYFKDIKRLTVAFTGDADMDTSMLNAFSKTRTDFRKTWMTAHMAAPPRGVEYGKVTSLPVSEFIHHDLSAFSAEDVKRSIPHVADGLKPSQRKVIHACLKRNLTSDCKVAQLAGYVAEHTAYHHGEASLHGTIVGLAQNFVGSNNLNLLEPSGQFGCLAPETEVLLWDSSSKQAKAVVVGDVLIGDDGTPRKVLQTVTGVDLMYKITMRNGESYTVNKQHIITLKYKSNKVIVWKESSQSWRVEYFDTTAMKVVSLSSRTRDSTSKGHHNSSKLSKDEAYAKIKTQIDQMDFPTTFDVKIEDILKLAPSTQARFYCVKNSECFHWEHREVPIDPYVFGCWLGDGNSNGCGITSADPEILQAFGYYLDTIDSELTHDTNKYDDFGTLHEGYHFGIRRKGSGFKTSIGDSEHSPEKCIGCQTSSKVHSICSWKFQKKPALNQNNFNPWKQVLKNNNLLDNKHIPLEYVVNDTDTRLQLLAGFIDTDGRLKNTNGCFSFDVSQSNRLRGDLLLKLQYICNSLGFRTGISYSQQGQVTSKGEDMMMMNLNIYGHGIEAIPTRLARKQIKTQTRCTDPYVLSFGIENVGNGTFCGWNIDGNERFLLKDFTITHNTRLAGGKDAASPRYIFTRLAPQTRALLGGDEGVLTYTLDDGVKVEPLFFAPVIPLVLVNGAEGIGTGWSCYVPPYNPQIIKQNIKNILEKKPMVPMVPWWRGFTGEVENTKEHTWVLHGKSSWAGGVHTVTELPPGKWIQDFKEHLEALQEKGVVQRYENNSTETTPKFRVWADEKAELGLTKTVHTSNMHLIGPEGAVKKYEKPEDIIVDYVGIRLGMYKKRKAHLLAKLEGECGWLTEKKRFINGVISGEVRVLGVPIAQVKAQLTAYQNVPKLLEIQTSKYTLEEVQALEKETQQKLSEHAALKETKVTTLWMNDLKIIE